MANLGLYTKALVYWNGKQLTEETSASVSRETNAQIVKTVAKGLAGVSPGAAMITVSVKNAAPSTDFELNPGPFMGGLQVGELTIFAAGRTLTSKGFILKDNFSHAVDSASELDFDFTGQFADWT